MHHTPLEREYITLLFKKSVLDALDPIASGRFEGPVEVHFEGRWRRGQCFQ